MSVIFVVHLPILKGKCNFGNDISQIYWEVSVFFPDCSQNSWEQSYFNMTAPNIFGSSSIHFGFCHPKVGSCHGMLGEVIYFAMTESPLRIHFYVLLPKYLGAVMLLSYCSQNSWEQSYLYLTAPKFFGSSQIMIGNSVYEVHMLLPNIFYCSQFL